MRDINTLHPKLLAFAQDLKAKAFAELGLKIVITECLRTAEEQAALYAQGRMNLTQANILRAKAKMSALSAAQNKFTVTNASTIESSFHGYGLAFDIAVVDPTGRIIDWSSKSDWNHDNINDWEQVGALGIALGLEWGGNWSSRPDMPHYQYTFGRTIAKLKADTSVVAGQTIKI